MPWSPVAMEEEDDDDLCSWPNDKALRMLSSSASSDTKKRKQFSVECMDNGNEMLYTVSIQMQIDEKQKELTISPPKYPMHYLDSIGKLIKVNNPSVPTFYCATMWFWKSMLKKIPL